MQTTASASPRLWRDTEGVLRGNFGNRGQFAREQRTYALALSADNPAQWVKSEKWARRAVSKDFPTLDGYEHDFQVERYAVAHHRTQTEFTFVERHAAVLTANGAAVAITGLIAGLAQPGPNGVNGADVAVAATVLAGIYTAVATTAAHVVKKEGIGQEADASHILGRRMP